MGKYRAETHYVDFKTKVIKARTHCRISPLKFYSDVKSSDIYKLISLCAFLEFMNFDFIIQLRRTHNSMLQPLVETMKINKICKN